MAAGCPSGTWSYPATTILEPGQSSIWMEPNSPGYNWFLYKLWRKRLISLTATTITFNHCWLYLPTLPLPLLPLCLTTATSNTATTSAKAHCNHCAVLSPLHQCHLQHCFFHSTSFFCSYLTLLHTSAIWGHFLMYWMCMSMNGLHFAVCAATSGLILALLHVFA